MNFILCVGCIWDIQIDVICDVVIEYMNLICYDNMYYWICLNVVLFLFMISLFFSIGGILFVFNMCMCDLYVELIGGYLFENYLYNFDWMLFDVIVISGSDVVCGFLFDSVICGLLCIFDGDKCMFMFDDCFFV